MFSARFLTACTLILCLAGGFCGADRARAQIPEDFFTAHPGGEPDCSTFTFGTPAAPPIPSDFFEPGSDPFEGQICIQGAPWSSPFPSDTSLLILRDADPFDRFDPPGVGAPVNIEIVELMLIGQEPITVTYFGGAVSEQWDLEIDLSAMPAPSGALMATKTHENGGVYDSFLVISPRFTFTRESDGAVRTFDSGLEGWAPLELMVSGAPWVHESEPSLEIVAPGEGLFVPGIEQAVPGDPASQCPVHIMAAEPGGAMSLRLLPSQEAPVPDGFKVLDGDQPDGTSITFGAGDNPPLPPDFFGPGSEPFNGTLPLEGKPPLLPKPNPDEPDSISARIPDNFGNGEWECTPVPPIRTDPSDRDTIEVVFGGIMPIAVTYPGKSTELWDMRMELPHPALRSVRRVFTKTHANGGTYTMEVTCNPVYTFTRVSDGTELTLDTNGLYPPLFYTAADGHWVHELGSALDIYAPNDGRRVLGVEEMVPGDPGTQVIRPLHLIDAGGAGTMTLLPLERFLSGVPGHRAGQLWARAYPNPCNPSTKIEYTLAAPGVTRVEIYNLRGEWIRTLSDGMEAAGDRHARWDGKDDRGSVAAAGVYFYRVSTQEGTAVGKIALIK